MPSPDHVVRQGDDGALIRSTLTEDDGTPVDLTDVAEVRLKTSILDTGAAKADGIGEVDGTPTDGKVRYGWDADTDIDVPGYQLGEWEIEFDDGAIRTFPSGGYMLIEVTAEVGDESLQPGQRDLCTLTTVLDHVPGYELDQSTDRWLRNAITRQSSLFQEDCHRTIVAPGEPPQTRDYELDEVAARVRRVDIDDLATLDDATVNLLNADGSEVGELDEDLIVPIYEGLVRAPTDEWEPIIALEFPGALGGAPSLTAGMVIRIEGAFGFPSVPPFVEQAVAARVLLRYINDVATRGTDLAEELERINVAGLIRTSEDAVTALIRPT